MVVGTRLFCTEIIYLQIKAVHLSLGFPRLLARFGSTDGEGRMYEAPLVTRIPDMKLLETKKTIPSFNYSTLNQDILSSI